MILPPHFPLLQQQLITGAKVFNDVCLDVFHYQLQDNEVYAAFVSNLGTHVASVEHYTQIPCLPVSFFKSREVTCFEPVWAQRIYTSSGTTGSVNSRHFVKNYADYERSFTAGFEHFYGDPSQFCILALLPDYLEREGSSLVEMAKVLIERSEHPQSGFYLDNHDELIRKMDQLQATRQPCLLLGVTFALLDLAAKGPFTWDHAIIMETGGMKGRRKEMIREEVHAVLKPAFGVDQVHSEYGMTELLSQAYSMGNGVFSCPPWMRVLTRDPNDPLSPARQGATGGINIIDLANLHSCSFIATQDLGKVFEDQSFEVLGRFDNSDLRGCNLMVG